MDVEGSIPLPNSMMGMEKVFSSSGLGLDSGLDSIGSGLGLCSDLDSIMGSGLGLGCSSLVLIGSGFGLGSDLDSIMDSVLDSMSSGFDLGSSLV